MVRFVSPDLTMTITEQSIRDWTKSYLAVRLDDPRSVLVDELVLPDGSARIDLALFNGRIEGYELKSDLDSLKRLPYQIAQYSCYFDRLFVVTTEKHLDGALSLLPEWWGVMKVSNRANGLAATRIRTAKRNPQRSLEMQLSLLWKSDLIELIKVLIPNLRRPETLGKAEICRQLSRVSRGAKQALRDAIKCRVSKKLESRSDSSGAMSRNRSN